MVSSYNFGARVERSSAPPAAGVLVPQKCHTNQPTQPTQNLTLTLTITSGPTVFLYTPLITDGRQLRPQGQHCPKIMMPHRAYATANG